MWRWHVWLCGHGMCVGRGGWGGLEKTVPGHACTHQAHTRHTPGTHHAHAGQAHIMHVACTCHAHTGHAHTMLMAHIGAPQTPLQNKSYSGTKPLSLFKRSCLPLWGPCCINVFWQLGRHDHLGSLAPTQYHLNCQNHMIRFFDHFFS